MRHTLRYILAAVMVLTAMASNAQLRKSALFGVGGNSLKYKQDLVTMNSIPCFQAGMLSELMFPGIGFGIDFGIYYNLGGAKLDLGERLMWSSQGYGKETLMLHQLTIPFHLRFKYTNLGGMEEILAPFLSVGPDLNVNVAHSSCKAMEYAGADVSFSGYLGVELYKRWQVSAGYTTGLTYATKAKVLKDYSARIRQWNLRVSYFF